MIADAVDTVITLGWALAVWIVLTAAAATLALYAVTVIAWTLLRPLRALWPRRGVCAPAGGPQGVFGDSRDAEEAPEPAEGRTAPRAAHAPSWAHTDHHKDAA